MKLAGPICEFAALFEIRGWPKIDEKSVFQRIFMVIFLVTVARSRNTLQEGGLHTLWCKVCNEDHWEFVMNRNAEQIFFTTETRRHGEKSVSQFERVCDELVQNHLPPSTPRASRESFSPRRHRGNGEKLGELTCGVLVSNMRLFFAYIAPILLLLLFFRRSSSASCCGRSALNAAELVAGFFFSRRSE